MDDITSVSFHWLGDSHVVLLAYKENQESWRWVPRKKRKRTGKHRAVYTTVNLSGHQTTIPLFSPKNKPHSLTSIHPHEAAPGPVWPLLPAQSPGSSGDSQCSPSAAMLISQNLNQEEKRTVLTNTGDVGIEPLQEKKRSENK